MKFLPMAFCPTLLLLAPLAAAELVMPPGATGRSFLVDGDRSLASVEMLAWAAPWKWLKLRDAPALGQAEAPWIRRQHLTCPELEITTDVQAHPGGLELRVQLHAAKDIELTQAIIAVTVPADGDFASISYGGDAKPLPIVRGKIPGVKTVSLARHEGGSIDLSFGDSLDLANDNGSLRIPIAVGKVPAGTVTRTFRINVDDATAPERAARFLADPVGADWFPFKPGAGPVADLAIDCSGWLTRPAGAQGRARMVGDHFETADGKPVRWWGTNLSYAMNAPAKEDAELHAKRFATWGVNIVRMHKWTGHKGWDGIGDKQDATKMTDEGWSRFDWFTAKLREQGVGYGWSAIYRQNVLPGNRDRVLAYDELMSKLKGDTYGLVNAAEDLQQLLIDTQVGLLTHRNPHTGLTYAEDPALAYVECQNEDDLFFFSVGKCLDQAPTYLAAYEKRFAAWLRQRYQDRAGLAKAWDKALKTEDDIEVRVGIATNPWVLSSDSLPKLSGGQRQRLLDQMLFMRHCQRTYYERFAAAVRKAGYDGPIVGSNWQAPTMLPHLANLEADQAVGFVDRHNYAGGFGQIGMTALDQPGSRLLSSGMQQVSNRPFILSEWNTMFPSLHACEQPPLIAAYGLGLNGWDGSFIFESKTTPGAIWSERVCKLPYARYFADVPNQIGQFPVLFRMVQRGDVAQAPAVSVRRVSERDLAAADFDFQERVGRSGSNGDIKTYSGTVGTAMMAKGRTVVEFTGADDRPSTLPATPDITRPIVSETKDLVWDAPHRRIELRSRGTQGAVGFLDGLDADLGQLRISGGRGHASVLLTASGREEDLGNCRTALLSATARMVNAGTRFSLLEMDKECVQNEGRPGELLMEPVRCTLRPARAVARCEIIDHDGRRSGRTVEPAADGSLVIDTGRDRCWFYEITFR